MRKRLTCNEGSLKVAGRGVRQAHPGHTQTNTLISYIPYSRTSLIDPLSLLLAVPSRRSSTGISGGYEHPLRCSPRLDIDTVVYYNALTANSFYIRGGLFPCVITISELYILTKNQKRYTNSYVLLRENQHQQQQLAGY